MRKQLKDRVLKFRAIIEKAEEGGYYGFVPSLKGVYSQGETIEEVRKNLREAILCHLQGLIKDKEKIPEDRESFEIIEVFPIKEILTKK